MDSKGKKEIESAIDELFRKNPAPSKKDVLEAVSAIGLGEDFQENVRKLCPNGMKVAIVARYPAGRELSHLAPLEFQAYRFDNDVRYPTGETVKGSTVDEAVAALLPKSK